LPPDALAAIDAGKGAAWGRVTNALRLGHLHEWFEVAMVATSSRFGLSSAQITRFTTGTHINPMFFYQGVPWAHAYNDAHRFNTYLLATSPGVLVYIARLRLNGLAAPGAYPANALFNWWDLALFPYR
jgi:hypothetical protein